MNLPVVLVVHEDQEIPGERKKKRKIINHITTLGFTWFTTSWKTMKSISFLSCRSDHRPEHRTMIKLRELNNYSPLALAAPDWNQRKINQYSNIRVRAEQIFFYHMQCNVPSLCYPFNAVFIDRLLYCYWVALLLLSEAYTLKSYFCTANPIFTQRNLYTSVGVFQSERVNYACVWALNKPLQKAWDEHAANIYHPDRNSTAAKCNCECNNKQRSTMGNEKSWGAKVGPSGAPSPY